MRDEQPTRPTGRYGLVVLVTGHLVDLPDRPVPRFPASSEPAVTEAVAATLRQWAAGPGTLVVCGGARGADLIAGEQALALGCDVWLLVALPEDEFVAASVAIPGTRWEQRFRRLRSRCPTWFQADALGPAGPAGNVFERNNDWCLATACAQARPALPRVLAVWDGRAGDGPGGTAHLVERARSLGAAVEVVDPADGHRGTVAAPAPPGHDG